MDTRNANDEPVDIRKREIRKFRRSQGSFSSCLVDEKDMLEMLNRLISRFQHYQILITRSSIDVEAFRIREAPETADIVTEQDGVFAFDREVGDKLRGAKRIAFVGATSDNGMVKVEVTQRTWENLNPSKDAACALAEFNKGIASRSNSRIFSTGFAGLIFWLPLLLIILFGMVDSLFYDAAGLPRHSREDPVGFSEYPFYFDFTRGLLYFLLWSWPFTAIAAIVLSIPSMFSGVLKAWPRNFSLNFVILYVARFLQDAVNIRLWTPVPASFFAGVATSVVAAIIIAVVLP